MQIPGERERCPSVEDRILALFGGPIFGVTPSVPGPTYEPMSSSKKDLTRTSGSWCKFTITSAHVL